MLPAPPVDHTGTLQMNFRLQAELSAEILDISIDPGDLEGIADNLALLHQHATRMMALDLPSDIESAPVYVP